MPGTLERTWQLACPVDSGKKCLQVKLGWAASVEGHEPHSAPVWMKKRDCWEGRWPLGWMLARGICDPDDDVWWELLYS